MCSMLMPHGVSKRWFGEVTKSVKPLTGVRIDHHWNVTEVCTVKTDELVAAFRAGKHAVEFCKLNSLIVQTGLAC
jgi:hypothetical protein